MSDEERLLWAELKTFRKYGAAFRKQAPVGPFIADFLCRKAKLIVEIDGRHHDGETSQAKDMRRDAWLFENGYIVLRFDAREVWQDIDGVVLGIEFELSKRLTVAGPW